MALQGQGRWELEKKAEKAPSEASLEEAPAP